MQRFDLTTRVQIPVSVSQYALAAVLSLWWPSVFLGVAVLVGTRAVGTVLLYKTAYGLFPRLRSRVRFDAKEFLDLFRFGGWLTVSSVISPLLVYADRFIIGGLLTLSAVAYYAVPLDASLRILLIPASLMTAVFPALSAAGSGDGARVGALASQSVRCIFSVLAVPATFGIVFSRDLIHAWLGESFAANSAPLLRILLVGIVANALARVPLAVLNASGRSDITAKLQLIELPFQAGTLFVLLRAYGLWGAALAWTLRIVVDAALLFLIARRVVGLQLDQVLGLRLAAAISALTLMSIAVGALLQTMAFPLARAALGTLLVATGSAGMWYWYLTERDRRGIYRELLGKLSTIIFSSRAGPGCDKGRP